MNHIHRAIAILGIITSIGGLSPSVYAQPPQTLTQERSAEGFNKQGLEKYHNGDYQGAIQDYDRAIRLNPNFAGAYVNRGNARDDMGDIQGAIADYNQAIRVNPKDDTAYYNRGISRIRARNY